MASVLQEQSTDVVDDTNPKKQRPERDPLEVGLDRNQKGRGLRLPRWMEEYGGWVVALVVISIFIIPVRMLGIFDRAPGPILASANLRIVFGPAKSWVEGSTTQIKSINVKIQNTGPEAAQNVQVQALVRASGFPLVGPLTIATGVTAQFSGATQLNITSEDAVRIQLSCANCPPPAGP